MSVLLVVGTRPNFMKAAPVARALRARGAEVLVVHTGQHYDDAMAEVFFGELGVRPDVSLGVGSGSHSQQTARVMERLEPVLVERAPDLVLVPGDVNSTLAAALVAAKLGIRLGHVEAGLRSFDRTMPEELNRILTDAVSDLLFTHSPEARGNLEREGATGEIHEAGNTMIDTLAALLPRIEAEDAPARHGVEAGGYVICTLHRPALVDGPLLGDALDALEDLARELPVVFPAHPRTRAAMGGREVPGVHVTEPLGYLEFMSLVASAAAALTDSGGIQEETTWLGIPCFTLRSTTERPVTVERGTNTLLGLEPARIRELPDRLGNSLLQSRRGAPDIPGWDGRAAERIADVVSRTPAEAVA
jgi:UDP-N-acetylglucosamine 2-epimerase (non-hydrolysing)